MTPYQFQMLLCDRRRLGGTQRMSGEEAAALADGAKRRRENRETRKLLRFMSRGKG